MSDLKVKDGFKVVSPGGSASWTVGQIVVPEGTVAKAFFALITFIVNATAAAASGMATAAQNALMEAVEATLKGNVGTKAQRIIIEKDTLATLRLDANATLEEDVQGGPGEALSYAGAKGLDGALVVGENRLVLALPISLGHIEPINESPEIFGAGAGQLERMELSFKFARDVVNALDSNVVVTGYEIDLRVVPQRTNSDGDPETLIPEVFIVKGGEKDSIETPDGSFYTGNDTDDDLATTPITQIEVTQGGQVVTSDAEPTDIQARFLAQPNSSALEVGVANSLTPLLRTGDTRLKNTKPGPIKVTMENHDKALVTRFLGQPLYSPKAVAELLAAEAARKAYRGGYVHMVNAASVEEVAAGEEHLAFTGWRYFTSSNPRFHTMAGLRCKSGGQVHLYVPPSELLVIANEYSMASRHPDPEAAKQGALAVLVKRGRTIPHIFASSAGAPPLGEETPIFTTFKRMVNDFLEDMTVARANAGRAARGEQLVPEPTQARRKQLADSGRDPNELYAVAF